MAKKQAFIISFEGIEGTGKSTQSYLLGSFLRKQGFKTAFFREPGSSVFGEQIRNILLHGKSKLSALTETLLFIAAREQLSIEKIQPNITKKDIVIIDRYMDATVAYQGYGSGVDIKLINQLNKAVAGKCIPDLTVLFDIDPEIGLIRCGRGDRFEKRKLSFHQRVRAGYLKIAKENPDRIKVIKVENDIKTIQNQLRDILVNEFNFGKRKSAKRVFKK
ncbi:MAG: dTMP kinase [Candidatus Omnitrophica bacterium]|nr:dTMP kinase [Candidatus Omnitrophota bacterium]